MGRRNASKYYGCHRLTQTYRRFILMTSFLIQGLCTDLAVVILVGLFDGINRVIPAYLEQQRRDELIHRGFIL